MAKIEHMTNARALVGIDVSKHRHDVLIAVPGKARRRRLTIPEFMAAYEIATKGEKLPKGAGAAKTAPGTIPALVASSHRSSDYLNLKLITQRSYHSTIEPLREQHGDKRVAVLKRGYIKGIIVTLVDRPAVANNWLKTIKILMHHTLGIEMRRDDPWISASCPLALQAIGRGRKRKSKPSIPSTRRAAVAGFSNWFRDRVMEEGLPVGPSAHGLRKAACRRLAKTRCSASQIMSLSGQKNLNEMQTYIETANRLGLARQALEMQIAAHESRTKIVKPVGEV